MVREELILFAAFSVANVAAIFEGFCSRAYFLNGLCLSADE